MECGSGTPQRLQRSSWVATRAGLVYMVRDWYQYWYQHWYQIPDQSGIVWYDLSLVPV
jgi:hypothetical protein